MSACSGNCKGCSGGCLIHCPICGAGAMIVPNETVAEMLIDKKSMDTSLATYICLNKKCNVTYFNAEELVEKKMLKFLFGLKNIFLIIQLFVIVIM